VPQALDQGRARPVGGKDSDGNPFSLSNGAQ
jgi:hypothetical protein